MRHIQFSSGFLLVLFFSVLQSPVAAESLLSTRHSELSLQGYYLVDSEYLPQVRQKITTLVEWGGGSQFSLLTNPDLLLQLGSGYGTISQENELIGDIDYALKRKSISAGFSLVKSNFFSVIKSLNSFGDKSSILYVFNIPKNSFIQFNYLAF